ncbi:MAG: hypothetical protein EON55_12030 [Alphaproteobacteria bacterium]|nr:MAG: hypothetical protein EON55_12030 [Alphaproteobacteria bacterium]
MFAKILRPVLAAAGMLLDRAHIESLAAAALADTDLSPEQRAIWSLAAFATDSVNQRDRLAGHGDELLSLFDGPSGSAFLDAFERGSDDEQVALAAGVFSVLAPSAAPYVELKSGRVRPEYRLSEAANGMLKRLGGLAVPAATCQSRRSAIIMAICGPLPQVSCRATRPTRGLTGTAYCSFSGMAISRRRRPGPTLSYQSALESWRRC